MTRLQSPWCLCCCYIPGKARFVDKFYTESPPQVGKQTHNNNNKKTTDMAASEAGLAGWKWAFEDDNSNVRSTRRSLRGRRSGSGLIVLTRIDDDLVVKGGDFLLVNDPKGGYPFVFFVKELELGTENFINITGLGFLRKNEVDLKLHPDANSVSANEIFLTGVINRIYAKNILHKVNVLNKPDFDLIVIDDSTFGTNFLCRRGYDTYYHTFSTEFDIEELQKKMVKDASKTTEEIREAAVKSYYHHSSDARHSKPRGRAKSATKSSNGETSLSTPSTTMDTSITYSSQENQIDEVEVFVEKKQRSLKPLSKLSNNKIESPAKKRIKLSEHVVSESENSDGDVAMSDEGEGGDDEDDDLESDDDDELESDEDLDSDEDIKRTRKPIRSKKPSLEPAKRGRKRRQKVLGPFSILNNGNGSHSKDENGAKVNGDVTESKNSAEISGLPCREEQFEQLCLTVESAINLESGTSIFISGTPGTGKTATVRQCIKKLSQDNQSGKLNDFDYLEINGMKLITPQSSYELIINKVSSKRINTSNQETFLENFFTQGTLKKPLVILLDELDQITEKAGRVVYNFFNWPTFKNSKLIIVAIANTMDLPERFLTNKVSSRLGLTRVQFPGYKHEELKTIITARLNNNENEKFKISNDAIIFASRKVASVSGDARRALKICERAIEIAKEEKENSEDNDSFTIQISHINKAINETTNSAISGYIKDLSFLGKIFLVGILSKKRKSGLSENKIGDIIDEIKQIIQINLNKSEKILIENKTIYDILYQDFIIRPNGFEFILNELIESGILIKQNLRAERTSLIKLNIADEEINSVFKREKDLQYLLDLI